MSSSSMGRFFSVILFAAIALIQGCISSNPVSTRFYVLDSLDGYTSLTGKESHPGVISIEILSLDLPQYLERPQIVTRNSINEIYIAEFHQWGGNLRKNMVRVLVKNLSRLLGTPDISTSRRNPRNPADFSLKADVMKFERDPDGKVRLAVQWRLSGKDKNTLATRMADIESSVSIAEDDYGQIVSAMGSLMGELSTIIGNEILKHADHLYD